MLVKKTADLAFVVFVISLTGSTATAQTAISDGPKEIVRFVETVSPSIKTGIEPIDLIILEYEKELEVEQAKQITETAKQNTIRTAEWAEADLFAQDAIEIDASIAELYSYVGVTPYGFGSTPEIWDCSGLTKWYLSTRGIGVVHSATWQINNADKIVEPLPGDLVGFQKRGASEYFHIGVYVGGGMMIHSANPAKDTVVQSVIEFANSEKSKIVFVRY